MNRNGFTLVELAMVITLLAVVVFALFCGGCGGGGSKSPISSQPQQIGNKLSGVSFGPYLHGNPDHGDTVSQADLTNYLGYVAANFKACRTYGARAGLEKYPAIAKGLGLKVAAACWLSGDLAADELEVQALIQQCQSGKVDIALIGSENQERNDLSEDQRLAFGARVKATGVKVAYPDTWNALVAHPRLIAASDEVWANIYPFWEGVPISQDIAKLQSDYNQLKAVCGGKKIVISETGWPSDGAASGQAVPSPENGAKYFADFVGWALGNNVDYFYFEAFDEPWKTEPGLVGPHWGIWDSDLQLKPGYDAGFKATAPVIPPIVNQPFTYTPIPGVPDPVNDLGKQIKQEERNVVTPGGTQAAPNFSTADQTTFESSGKLTEIVNRVKASTTFTSGVAAIVSLPAGTRSMIIAEYERPLYLSWGILGSISDNGTTDAGYAVEGRIANALTNEVRTALGLPTSNIINQPFTYTPIASVPDPVNDLGRMIDQEQRNVVTPGGNASVPGFSWVDKSNFDNSGRLTEIVNRVQASLTFSDGVASIRTLATSDQTRVFNAYSRPLYPTWAMNGHIGSDGTTDAGYQAEGEIATALTNAVKAAL